MLFVFDMSAKAGCREGIMIYEIYGGGGNVGAIYKSDYIMLYNSTNKAISLEGWLLQYASSSGVFTPEKTTPLSKVLPGMRYFLVQQGNIGLIGKDLPEVDKIGSMNSNLAATSGKVALVNSDDIVNSENIESFVDFVAYDKGNNTKSVYRKNSSCLDSDDYATDFSTHAPNPRNSSIVDDNSEGEEEDERVNATSVCKDRILLSEIFPFNGEFVEVENIGTEKCDLVGWKISDQANSKKEFEVGSIIEGGKYLAFVKDFGLNSSSVDGAKLFDPAGELKDEMSYQKPPSNGLSFSKNEFGKWSWTTKTPNEKNVFESNKEEELKKEYPSGISITELFPNPFQSQYEEYVELYNGTLEDVDLLGWTLRDASKSGKHTFLESTTIKAKQYLAIFKNDFKFALNNSGKESVTLFNPNGKEVSQVNYDGSKKNISYNFDGARWRWSKFLTPGSFNVLNNEPYGNVKIDKDVFVNTYADFFVSTGDLDGEQVKVVWDFGDKHKSYLSKTRHKYEKKGTYDVSVKLSDGSEDVLKNFTVEVKEFPHPKIRIISIDANPKGVDTKVETLTIENKSKKKINLKGWSIATGWKKFINHPIREDFIIAKNKSKEITSKFSSFTLNNAKANIQLRYPDGEVAHEVKYKSLNKSIADGEIYQKVEGGWVWVETQKSSVISKQSSENANSSPVIENTEINEFKEDKVEEAIVPVEIKRENKVLINDDDLIKIELLKSQPQVLGAETVREINGQYLFTPESQQKEHYAIVFLKNISTDINLKINVMMNYFFK